MSLWVSYFPCLLTGTQSHQWRFAILLKSTRLLRFPNLHILKLIKSLDLLLAILINDLLSILWRIKPTKLLRCLFNSLFMNSIFYFICWNIRVQEFFPRFLMTILEFYFLWLLCGMNNVSLQKTFLFNFFLYFHLSNLILNLNISWYFYNTLYLIWNLVIYFKFWSLSFILFNCKSSHFS